MSERSFIRIAWAIPGLAGAALLLLKLVGARVGYAKPVFWLMFGGLAALPLALTFFLWSRNKTTSALRRASVLAPLWLTVVLSGLVVLNPFVWFWTAMARPLAYLRVVATVTVGIAAASYGYLGIMALLLRGLRRMGSIERGT